METNTLFPALFVGALFLLLFKDYLFLPYRNVVTRWWMKQFNPYYKSSKKLFDELVVEQKKWTSKKDPQVGYYNFLIQLYNDKRFKSAQEKAETFLEGLGYDSISDNGVSLLNFEAFTAFKGNGVYLHQVTIFFSIGERVSLSSIELTYQEETKPNFFMYTIEKKIFPPNDDDDDEIMVSNGPPKLVLELV